MEKQEGIKRSKWMFRGKGRRQIIEELQFGLKAEVFG